MDHQSFMEKEQERKNKIDRVSKVGFEQQVSLNFADIKEIYERNDIPMDADAIGLQPLYYPRDQLTKFIEELNFYFEKISKISS